MRCRNIYTRAVLEIPGAHDMVIASLESGWQCRVYPDFPMKPVMVDERAALLPLGLTGMEGAVLVRAPVILAAALRMYFELLWGKVRADGRGHGHVPGGRAVAGRR